VALHGGKAGPPRAGRQTAAHAQEVAVRAVRQEKSLEGPVGSNPSASGLAEAGLEEAVWPRPRRIITVDLGPEASICHTHAPIISTRAMESAAEDIDNLDVHTVHDLRRYRLPQRTPAAVGRAHGS